MTSASTASQRPPLSAKHLTPKGQAIDQARVIKSVKFQCSWENFYGGAQRNLYFC